MNGLRFFPGGSAIFLLLASTVGPHPLLFPAPVYVPITFRVPIDWFTFSETSIYRIWPRSALGTVK